MLISLAEGGVVSRPKSAEIEISREEFSISGTAYPVLEATPLKIEILPLDEHRLRMTASGRIVLGIPCSRCLDQVPVPFSIETEEEIDLSKTEERERDPDAPSYVSGAGLDTEELLLSEIIAAFPMQVLCKEDCRGLCKVCGCNLNHETCDCDTEVPDPRMAAFSHIFDQFKEV